VSVIRIGRIAPLVRVATIWRLRHALSLVGVRAAERRLLTVDVRVRVHVVLLFRFAK
jgi:hypothetical protein